MDHEKKQAVALFRYGVIAPLVTGSLRPGMSKDAFYRQAAQKTYPGPDGEPRSICASTVEKWYLAYRKDGFGGLFPSGRSDAGKSRKLDPDIQERIRFLKTAHPDMPSSEIRRALISDGSMREEDASLSTVERFVKNSLAEEAPQDNEMRRYEREHINEVWCGDTCFGPYLDDGDGKKRVYVIALIDDASRFIVGADLFYQDTFASLLGVIRSAVAKHGRPMMFNFDNGPSYHNLQMELLAARIGSSVHFNPPYTPTGKAKIERWFATCRMQFLSCQDMRGYRSLDAFRDSFAEYVRRYNLSPHSSLAGKSPQDRFFEEPERIRRLPPERLETDFLFELERRVSADGVVSINKTEYEVPCRYAGQRIRLRYSAGMEKAYVESASGGLEPIRLLDKKANAKVKREKVRLSEGGRNG